MSEPVYRPLTRAELDTVIEWAAAEGWNPGANDAEAFWKADPEAFVGIELDGTLVGSGAIVSYAGAAGFMGLFIVAPEHRHRGLGGPFWTYRRDLLLSRLQPGGWIGMDGVFAMQPFYAKGGFVFSHRNLRMEGIGSAQEADPAVIDLAGVSLAEVEAFDRRVSLVPRSAFLEKWVRPQGGKAVGYVRDGMLAGYAVIRPCRVGYKIGPLFADDAGIAEAIYGGLSTHAAGQPVFLDIPENNPDAVALAARHGLREVFGCARMYLGPAPEIPWRRVYGVTTFELG